MAAAKFGPVETAQLQAANDLLDHVIAAPPSFAERYAEILDERPKAAVEARDALEALDG